MSWQTHDPHTISRWAAELAAARGWRLDSCAPWKEGASNAIWALETDRGSLVLKVGKLEYWRRLKVEAAVLGRLRTADVPRLVDWGEADGRFPWDWAVLERVEGTHPFSLDPHEAAELGRLLQRIHDANQGLPLEDGGWRAYFEHRVKSSLDIARPGLPDCLAPIFERRIADLEALGRLGDELDRLPPAVAHGDITPYNLIKRPDGSFCLLDWEHPRRAPAAWDLACIRKAFRLDVPGFTALCSSLGAPPPARPLAFADALYQMQVCCWRAEMWFGRGKRDYGDFFLIELGEELARAELLLRGLQTA